MSKRGTRVKYHVVNKSDDVVWDVLATELPSRRLMRVLAAEGYTVVRTSGKKVEYRGPTYSSADPSSSVVAAIEAADRADTLRNRVLLLLIRRNGTWVSRENVRLVGGDSGDRRVRELRDEGDWPIEIKQLKDGQPWVVRLDLDDDARRAARKMLLGDTA